MKILDLFAGLGGEMRRPQIEARGQVTPEFTNSLRTPLSLRRLVSCVRALGLRLGWKYWRIQKRCSVNPWLVLEWAQNCEDKADELRDTAPELSAAHRDWAHQLRAAYERYKWGKAPNDPDQRPAL